MHLDVTWDDTDGRAWHGLLQQAGRCPLQQAWSYGEAIRAQGHEVRRARLVVSGRTVAVAQLAFRRFFRGFGFGLLMRGPVWLEPRACELEPSFMAAIRRECHRKLVLWSPECMSQEARRGGYRRVLTGYSTIWLDLRRDDTELRAGLDQKWRNMLCRSEEAGLELREVAGGKQLDWLIERNEAHRRKVGYRGPTPDFIRQLGELQPKGHRLALVALEGREPIAGVIVDRHGESATYFAGCTSERGRQLRAHHRLLWRAIQNLRGKGVHWLDLGGIDTEKAGGVARFKLGMGGEPVTLAGSYLMAPSFAQS